MENKMIDFQEAEKQLKEFVQTELRKERYFKEKKGKLI